VDRRVGVKGRHETRLKKVADQHLDDADREIEPGRDLRNGQRLVPVTGRARPPVTV
jgi:hypothetical protein